MTNPRPNPYPGPRSFQRGETLYGRERETAELLGLLIAERIVLLSSPSGAGKTSLVQAALVPELERESFRVLPVMRPGLLPEDVVQLGKLRYNRYTLSLLLALERDLPAAAQTPLAELAALSLADYLQARWPSPQDDAGAGAAWHGDVLIFDQFEEVLTVDPTDRDAKLALFEQLGAALRDRNRWALFAIREEFVAALDPYQALAVAQAQDAPLRLRLNIAPGAPELHNLHWETLRLPGGAPGSEATGTALTGENLFFSRYLSSLDWKPVRLRPESSLAALVAVAAPSDAGKYGLAPVDAAQELAAARRGLGEIAVTELATAGQVTLNNLAARLRDGCDILYLVAHGMLVDGEPWLFLENEDGMAQRVPGRELANRIRELDDRPRLAVLVSCQSAGTGQEPAAQDDGALAGLGPRLAEAGVPAVIAMQGNLTMKTAAAFLPVFFQELRGKGLVDRAMALARGAVRNRPDAWMPVLFMRLKSGRIGYATGFGGGLTTWDNLLRMIERKKCTPILGPGLNEWLLGSTREIAATWAERHGYAMDPDGRESLPQVAQYLKTTRSEFFLQDEFVTSLREQILQRYRAQLPAGKVKAGLDELVSFVATLPQAEPAMQPYRALARLRAPIYFTTSPTNLLHDVLRASDGVKLEVVICPWKKDLILETSVFEREPGYRPTPERPLVYHLFGRMSEPQSLVLTEDDYFDYLLGVTENNDLIPIFVREAMTNASLLFLGFNLEDWSFRVLFRNIANRESAGLMKKYGPTAAQIDPAGGYIIEPEGARLYLQNYFGRDWHFGFFWGSVAEFGRELAQRLK